MAKEPDQSTDDAELMRVCIGYTEGRTVEDSAGSIIGIGIGIAMKGGATPDDIDKLTRALVTGCLLAANARPIRTKGGSDEAN